MSHVAAALFFLGLIVGLASIMQMTVRDHWAEIIAALRGQQHPRTETVTVRVRAVVPAPARQRRAGAF